MLTVEEIKRCIEEFKPDGFGYDILIDDGDYPYVRTFDGASYYLGDFPFHDICMELWENIYYPLFLQRVIEGINKEYRKINVYINNLCVWIRYKECGYFEELSFYYVKDALDGRKNDIQCGTIDQAKEQAIKYILENTK